MKLIALDNIKKFISSLIKYALLKIAKIEKQNVVEIASNLTQEYMNDKGISIEEGTHFSEIQTWLQQHFGISLSTDRSYRGTS